MEDTAVVLLYKRKAQDDEAVLSLLERALKDGGYKVFIDRHLQVGVEWAREIEWRIRSSRAVIVLLSEASEGSEMLQFEVETAADERRKRGLPMLLPIRIKSDQPLQGSLGASVNDLNFLVWGGPEDDASIVSEVLSALECLPEPGSEDGRLEPVGGAVSLDSRFYVVRESDSEFEAALRANESVVLVHGPRQIGKTSLLGRGTSLAHSMGWRVISTDFQMISAAQLQDEEKFARLLAATMARQLDFKYDFEGEWLDVFGPNMNLSIFLRAALSSSEVPLVWFMDEADRLFAASFSSDFFGLVRSWHNARATDPTGPWGKFTLAISYATEARLFIRDLNQSPFNVGRHVPLRNFDLSETIELNERYGSPIKRRSDVEALQFLVAGHPFLTRRALDQIASGRMTFAELFESADRDDGPFGDHLKRMLISVSQVPEVLAATRSTLAGLPLSDSSGLHRLIAAGVLKESGDNQAAVACDLYAQYLDSHLRT